MTFKIVIIYLRKKSTSKIQPISMNISMNAEVWVVCCFTHEHSGVCQHNAKERKTSAMITEKQLLPPTGPGHLTVIKSTMNH